MMRLTLLTGLLAAAALALGLQSSFGSAGDSSEQHGVEDWIAHDCASVPPDAKPPQQAFLRPVESEADEEIVRQIAQLLLEAQEEGRALDEEQLRPLFEQLAPDRVVILGDC